LYNMIIVYPGTSPEDMENLIVDPLEKAINELDGITEIESFVSEGLARVGVNSEFEGDYTEKYNEVLRQINSVRGDLPDGIVLFDVRQIKPEEMVNYLVFALSSENVSYSELQNLAEDFEDKLEAVKGLNKIKIEASPAEEIRVSLDYERMAAQNITLGQVVGILRSNNVNIPGGNVSAGTKNFTIKSTGGYENIEEIKNTIVAAGNNRIVYLKDIAEVKIENEDLLWKAEFNKMKSIFITLKLKTGENIIDVDQEVQLLTQEFKSELPKNVQLNVSFEQASAVKTRINEFFSNLLQGVLLVGIVIFLVLGWRSAFIIITLIPLCMILSLGLLKGAGFGLQQISIASLVLALGLLVDNGIVVIENINRFIQEGLSRREAAMKGASEVGLAIFSSTVTTVLSFFPLSQLGEGAGLFLKSLPYTVILTLVISLILALTFSPILSNWVMAKKARTEPSYADKFFHWLEEKIYDPILRFSLNTGWLIMVASVAVFIFSFSLFPKIGVSFFPTADKPLLLIDIRTPRGSSMEETEKAVEFVESILDTMDYVKNFTTNVGHGNPQIYYNKIPASYMKSRGEVLVNFTEWDQGRFYKALADLRKEFKKYGGAQITTEELKNGVPVGAPIEIQIVGEDLKILKKLSLQVEETLAATPNVINVNNPMRRNQTQLKINLNKEKAGLLGVSELDFDQTVRASLNGLAIDKITLDDDEDYNLVIRMPFDESPSIEDLNKIYVANRMGGQIPLNHIADVQFEGGVAQFEHLDLKRNTTVFAGVTDLDKTILITQEIIEKLGKIDLPRGYKYVIGGEYKEQQSTFGSLGVILILAQVAIFAVLVLQFRSVLQPFIVFSAIPLAICGSFIALYLTGWPFSFFAFVGLISLIGIVVNNSIILVDYINKLVEEGQMTLQEAIITGSKRRFKPIVLTSITTILGLVPLTMQRTNQWSPLTITIIGGMISSTVLALVVVPVLYKWFTKPPTPKGEL
jgi:multidrug efflux pump subunit AcrB